MHCSLARSMKSSVSLVGGETGTLTYCVPNPSSAHTVVLVSWMISAWKVHLFRKLLWFHACITFPSIFSRAMWDIYNPSSLPVRLYSSPIHTTRNPTWALAPPLAPVTSPRGWLSSYRQEVSYRHHAIRQKETRTFLNGTAATCAGFLLAEGG